MGAGARVRAEALGQAACFRILNSLASQVTSTLRAQTAFGGCTGHKTKVIDPEGGSRGWGSSLQAASATSSKSFPSCGPVSSFVKYGGGWASSPKIPFHRTCHRLVPHPWSRATRGLGVRARFWR